MYKIMLIYPPGKMYQRGEDRSQGNIDDSSATSMRACNDLGYAAAVLLRQGYEVFLKDYQTEKLTETDLFFDLQHESIDMIVMSVTNATIFSDIELVNRIRTKFQCIVVLKGAIFYNAETEMLKLLDLKKVDFLVGGELDFAIGKIADYSFKNMGNVQDINNIFYKDKCSDSDYKMIPTKFHVWDTDLDAQPFPARQLMKNNLYVRPDTGKAMATIQTSRGCPARCIYCLSPDISGRKVRFRTPQNVFEEIVECYTKYNIKNFFFKADTFTIDAKWVEQLCHLIINSELYGKIEFTANSRVRPLQESTLKLMKKAGCFAVAFGFESGNQKTLDMIKKGTTIEDNIKAMQWAHNAKLQVYGFYMIGFPWETKEMINDTIKHMFELNADFIEIHIALPYYGTELYDLCQTEGVLKKGTLGSDYFHSSIMGTKYVTIEELVDIRNKAMKKYYLRPAYIMKKLCYSIKTPIVFKNYIKYGLRLLKNMRRKI